MTWRGHSVASVGRQPHGDERGDDSTGWLTPGPFTVLSADKGCRFLLD